LHRPSSPADEQRRRGDTGGVSICLQMIGKVIRMESPRIRRGKHILPQLRGKPPGRPLRRNTDGCVP